MSVFGSPPRTIAPGDWIRVPFDGHPLARVEMKIGNNEWQTCYHDNGDVMIRAKGFNLGSHDISLRVDSGPEESLGSIEISTQPKDRTRSSSTVIRRIQN